MKAGAAVIRIMKKSGANMGWSFRKSIKIAPGVRVNLSKSGISTSIGGRGFTYNTRGRVTASIPGTGVRYTHNLNARRAARPVQSAVVASNRIDSESTERLSKREQATRDFVRQMQERTTAALQQYFISHGVYVVAGDLTDAVALEEHQPFLESLSKEFEVTTKAIRLAVDIGSISLAEKEKAMLALYEVERKCTEHRGERGQLEVEAGSLLSIVRAWPKAPTLTAPFLVGLLASLFLYLKSVPIGLTLVAAAVALGVYSVVTFNRKEAFLTNQLAEVNEKFNSLLTAEVSPRPTPAGEPSYLRAKAIGISVLTGVVVLSAVLYRSQDVANNDATASPPSASTLDSSVPISNQDVTPQAGQRQASFSWLVGKSPSDVVNNPRFRAAFNHASRSDWRKIADRLVVTSGSGIESKDGYIVGQGCKAHFCASDMAAFAINEATGKGDVIFKQTVDFSTGKSVVKSVVWGDMPLESTPLADWAKSNEEASDSLASTSVVGTTLQTSFDCTKARSDAEHLICSDAELAADDVELAAIFAKAKAAATDQAALKERTRAEWNYREQNCHDRTCLVRWYADQKAALQQIADTGNVGGN
jgi:uncharacterized protein DUF4236